MYYNDYFTGSIPKSLSKDELNKCLLELKNGNQNIRDYIINSNIRLVIYIVNKNFINTTYDTDELISVGLLGLIKAVDTFDISKNFEFATYASRCISNEILMFMRKGKKSEKTSSLEDVIGYDSDGKGLKIADLVCDSKDFTADYENKEIYAQIRGLVENLEEPKREIIMLHFGFKDRIYTQKEIANKLNLSQSYISRLVKKFVKEIKEKLIKNGVIDNFIESKDVAISKSTEKEKNMPRQLQSIYEYFKDYTKEQVDEALSNLTKEELELIHLRYGENLSEPTANSNWTKENNNKFYGSLIPKMKRLLSKSTIKGTTLTNPIDKPSFGNKVGIKEFYIKLLSVMKDYKFSEMLKFLTPKEAIIICLKLGYVDDKFFTTATIADFLEISEDEVRETVKKVLLLYKDNINNIIDKAIDIASDEIEIKEKVLKATK